MRRWTVLLLLLLGGCEAAKALAGIFTVEVHNLVLINGQRLDGVTIKANGVTKFTIDYGQKKTFTHQQGSVIITATHPQISTDPQITLNLQGDLGLRANMVLSTRKILGIDIAVLNCNNCSSQSLAVDPRNPMR